MKKTLDGNEAAAKASYLFTEVATVFPITPSSPMAEKVDEWAAAGKKNLLGQTVRVVEMQSEGGAAGALHGSLQAGALTTTYTASQGLLLMIPEMYKLAGNLMPAVFHVSARALATHALSIFGDHQDINACRQTGFALLCSNNVQECLDLAYMAHLTAISARTPFLHFFDGFRTSHEIQKIETVPEEDIVSLVDHQAIAAFRRHALSPEHPVLRGSAQNADIYFQVREAANPFSAAVPETIEKYFAEYQKITGREYHAFQYYGDPQAEEIIIAMGSVCNTIEETIDYLQSRGEKVGLLKVRLYRPFSAQLLLKALPKSVQKIAVLDRTKELGSTGEPLYLDVLQVVTEAALNVTVVGGRYGLGSKDTTPSQILAVYENLKQATPQNHFTVGIVDDVSHLSLPLKEKINATPVGTTSCKLWGLGSDGTVGANKSAVKIIGDNTDLYAQGYFEYDSKKSGGTTISHLRFGKQPIKSSYLVSDADYVACHNPSFLYHYDLWNDLKPQSVFVLNCPWTSSELADHLPSPFKSYLAKQQIQFYIIDAVSIAQKIGLGGRINMIMQAAFFKLTGLIAPTEAIRYLKEFVAYTYGKKDARLVEMNHEAIDQGMAGLKQVEVPASWADLPAAKLSSSDTGTADEPDYTREIQRPVARHDGDSLPVSAFCGLEDGTQPLGTTQYEKRGIAVYVPEWQIDKCIQCNQCSLICPHATIRPFLLNEAEQKNAPAAFKTKQPSNPKLKEYGYRIQVSPLDCTGCGNCADICPAPGKALIMKPADQEIQNESENWEFAMTITEKPAPLPIKTVIGSQFIRPLLEFNGACPGCGETPYAKLLTQLFGDRMIIANATGCSSIWGGSCPSIPYTVNAEGKGPAWMNPLFEDDAEFGYGIQLGHRHIRVKLAEQMREWLKNPTSQKIEAAFRNWLMYMDDGEQSKSATKQVLEELSGETKTHDPLLKEILAHKDYLVKPSVWIFGGDGFAYDIGYNGVDHVLASGEDINMLILDTEVYSNTGGQASKATPTAALAKFTGDGKRLAKKDLGLMAATYGYVYVAQIALGASMLQTVQAMAEAESYPGPSLIIAYAPCVNHGIRSGMGTSLHEMKKAVEAGYWHLWRYNPLLRDQGKNSWILDSKEPSSSYQDFLTGELRFSSLKKAQPDRAQELFELAEQQSQTKYAKLQFLAEKGLGK